MKPFLLISILSISLSFQVLSQVTGGNGFSVMSWNIRYNNPGDGINAWPNRKDRVVDLLRKTAPAVICLQEVLAGQLDELAAAMPDYAWFGVGRDDGSRSGEFVPVLYLQSRFRQVRGGQFWLSESPDIPGKLGWDAVCARMVTWISLADKLSGDTLTMFNTHFDHVGVKARLMSARLLAHAADSIAGSQAAIITGDFNASDRDTLHEVIKGAGFRDSRAYPAVTPAGPVYTFTGFATSGKPGERIDYIYVRNTKPVRTYLVRDDSSNGFYLSDHLPVMVGF